MMNAHYLKLTLTLLGYLILAGCQIVPVVPHAFNCDVSEALLNGKCASPEPIASDATYAALVDAMQADRKALQECGITADTLREAIKRCNQATGEYNNKIDVLNSTR